MLQPPVNSRHDLRAVQPFLLLNRALCTKYILEICKLLLEIEEVQVVCVCVCMCACTTKTGQSSDFQWLLAQIVMSS